LQKCNQKRANMHETMTIIWDRVTQRNNKKIIGRNIITKSHTQPKNKPILWIPKGICAKIFNYKGNNVKA